MNYTIRPESHQLEKARNTIETAVSKYEHSVEAGEVEFYIGWQDIEGAVSVITDSVDTVTVILDPEEEWEEELENEVFRSMLEVEFLEEADYSIEFNWQELAKWAYVLTRMNRILEEETREDPELEQHWPELKQELSNEVGEYSQKFHRFSIPLAEMIGQELLKEHELEKFPGLKKSDVIEAGDQLFGE